MTRTRRSTRRGLPADFKGHAFLDGSLHDIDAVVGNVNFTAVKLVVDYRRCRGGRSAEFDFSIHTIYTA